MDRKTFNKISERILQVAPTKSVIAGSTPVISFGDFTRAKIATLGINPSSKEFLSRKKLIIVGKKRLADYETLGLGKNDRLNSSHVEAVWNGCQNYFAKSANPYMTWFGQLDQIIKKAGYSYSNGTACHLDLIQWATDPVWRDLSVGEQKALLQSDLDFFLWQSEMPNIDLRLLNGKTAVENFMNYTNFELKKIDQIQFRNGDRMQPINLFKGFGKKGEPILGWSINIQSARLKQGVRPEVIGLLGRWVKSQA